MIFKVPKDYNNMSSGKIKLNAMIHRAKDMKKYNRFVSFLTSDGPGGEAVRISFPNDPLKKFSTIHYRSFLYISDRSEREQGKVNLYLTLEGALSIVNVIAKKSLRVLI